MTSIRALSNLHCANCGEVTLHASNVCQATGCGQINRDSGNPPVPRQKRLYGYSTIKARDYSASAAEQSAARRRARQARHQVMRGAATK